MEQEGISLLEKETLLNKNIGKATNYNGIRLDVQKRALRFPNIGGIHQKITLHSNVTAEFMNIGFMAGVDNTIHGNIADDLLDKFPDVFSIIKVNGKVVKQGEKNQERDILKQQLIAELREEFELKPKEKKDSSRARAAQSDIAAGKAPSSTKTDISNEVQKPNSFTKK